MAEKDKLEVIASHHFVCRGINKATTQPLDKEDAVPAVVNVYKDGKSEVGCPFYYSPVCEAPVNPDDYIDCPFKREPRNI